MQSKFQLSVLIGILVSLLVLLTPLAARAEEGATDAIDATLTLTPIQDVYISSAQAGINFEGGAGTGCGF